MLRRYSDAEKYLEKILDSVQGHTTNDLLIYTEYNNLFLHRIKTNLNKVNQNKMNNAYRQFLWEKLY